jgi:hypothetical protein
VVVVYTHTGAWIYRSRGVRRIELPAKIMEMDDRDSVELHTRSSEEPNGEGGITAVIIPFMSIWREALPKD